MAPETELGAFWHHFVDSEHHFCRLFEEICTIVDRVWFRCWTYTPHAPLTPHTPHSTHHTHRGGGITARLCRSTAPTALDPYRHPRIMPFTGALRNIIWTPRAPITVHHGGRWMWTKNWAQKGKGPHKSTFMGLLGVDSKLSQK